MSTPVTESWDRDSAHAAVQQWITAWREVHPKPEPQPSLKFGAHLGREARELMDARETRADMQRIFAAHAYDGVCVCGLRADTDPKFIDPSKENV